MSVPGLIVKSVISKNSFWTKAYKEIDKRGFWEALVANLTSGKVPISRHYPAMVARENVVWRGVATNSMLKQTMMAGHLRKGSGIDSLDPVDHAVYGTSKWVVSATSAPHTAAVYSSINKAPGFSGILELAQPEVYFCPADVLITNPGSTVSFDNMEKNKSTFDDMRSDHLNFESSSVTLERNPDEVAIVTHYRDQILSRALDTSLSAVHEVLSAGKFAEQLKLVSDAEKAYHIRSHHNPDFEITPVSVKIAGGHFDASRFPEMNENALKGGLIKEGERLLTIDDARAIFPTEASLHQFQYEGITKTLKITSVPQEIAVGDRAALMDYVNEALEMHKRLTIDTERTSTCPKSLFSGMAVSRHSPVVEMESPEDGKHYKPGV